MESQPNSPSCSSSSTDEGKQPIIEEEEEIRESSGTKVDPLPEFFRSVESALGDRNGEYTWFIYFMNDLLSGREVDRARSRIEEMLKEHQELLAQCKTFFPELERGEVVNPPQDDDIKEKTLQFYLKVKACFQGGERLMVFISILRAFVAGTKNSLEMYNELEEVFIDDPDLLHEFTTLLQEFTTSFTS